MAKKFIVNLNATERDGLLEMISQGKVSARMVKRANILLLADEGSRAHLQCAGNAVLQ